MPRVLDVLMGEKDAVLDLLRDGRDSKQIWHAFGAAGLQVSYSAFSRAMKNFVGVLGLPSSGRRGRTTASRFLERSISGSARPASGNTRGSPESTAAQRRQALAKPTAAEMEARRVAEAALAAS
jgi:hypothetical protein